jgi:hypothetical protein
MEGRAVAESSEGRTNTCSGSGSGCGGLWNGISGDGDESTSVCNPDERVLEPDADDRPRCVQLEINPPRPPPEGLLGLELG